MGTFYEPYDPKRTIMHYGVKGMKWKNHTYVNRPYGTGYTDPNAPFDPRPTRSAAQPKRSYLPSGAIQDAHGRDKAHRMRKPKSAPRYESDAYDSRRFVRSSDRDRTMGFGNMMKTRSANAKYKLNSRTSNR